MRATAWTCLFACTVCSGQILLPRRTADVKFQQGRLMTLEANEHGSVVKVWSADGKLRRSIEVGAGLTGVRRVELKDYALAADGSLVTSLGAIFSMGATSRLLAVYPEKGEPSFVTLDDVVCLKLMWDLRTGAWCLGPGLEDTLLHRVSGPAQGRWSLVTRKKLRLIANSGGETREAFESGQAGVPALLPATPGRLLAWLPNAGTVLEVDTVQGAVKSWDVPLAIRGRSTITFACSQDGAVYGLMPLRGPSEEELLTTRYGLVRLDRDSGIWTPLPQFGNFPRGSVLAGMDGDRPMIWNRRSNVVTSQPAQGGGALHAP